MKPVLIFTNYVEHHDEFTVSMSVTASFNGKEYSYHSPNMSQQKATDGLLDHALRGAVDVILNEVIDDLNKTSDNDYHARSMALLDKFSLFEIKQHVDFNNGLHQWYRDTNILLVAIW